MYSGCDMWVPQCNDRQHDRPRQQSELRYMPCIRDPPASHILLIRIFRRSLNHEHSPYFVSGEENQLFGTPLLSHTHPMPPHACSYLHLPSVLLGLGELSQAVLGVALSVQPARQSETWAHGVLRCDATHDELGFLGTVYLDLCR